MNKDGKIEEFTDLDSWKEAHKLVVLLYKTTKKFPSDERFGLISQIQRAGVSISSNIAEGFGRQTLKEKIQFYYQAHGSLTEIKNQIILSKDLEYINENDFVIIKDQIIISQKLLRGLIRKTKSYLS
ncbi:MAG: four helix bundle protein [Candidatus Zambryskibacteria bacterium]|nr:four helix bundle protein [Candidatus Zambryskibacteria bacterium]